MKIDNIKGMPVMRKQCATCPFRDGPNGRPIDCGLVAKVQERVLTTGSQICHHPRTKGKKQTHLCRGARDFQLNVLYRVGFLEAPTDAAWDKKLKEMKRNENKTLRRAR